MAKKDDVASDLATIVSPVKPDSEAKQSGTTKGPQQWAGSSKGLGKKAEVPKVQLAGSLDKIDELEVLGWIADKSSLETRLDVAVIVDGKLIGRTKADLPRRDVLEAGIGDGNYGFSFTLSAALCDGKEHHIEIRELSTAKVLPGSPAVFRFEIQKAEVSLEWGALTGWVNLPGAVYSPVGIDVYENGFPVISANFETDSEDRKLLRFRLVLPAKLLDGQLHLFSIRVRDPALLVAELAEVTPFYLTPQDALHNYARDNYRARLNPVAGFRYESLIGAIEKLSDRATSTATTGKVKQGKLQDVDGYEAGLRQILATHSQVVRGFSDDDKKFAPLNFPKIENPKVSIVIPVHNKFPVTYNCLASLLLAPNDASFEVILVDDGSSDISKDIPSLVSGVKYVRNETAQGFIRACNRGGKLAKGEYIVMLNNDIEVTRGWLDELVWVFEHFDGVGLAGAKLLYPDGHLQEAGGIVWGNGDPWNYGRNGNANDPRYNYTRQVDYISGACIMLPRKLWDELGGFDEIFVPAYFEDTDLAFRVRDKGYKVVYVPLSQVFHFEGISSGTSTQSGIKRYQEINRPKFKSRWAKAYRQNGIVGQDVELNKDRNIEFRALVIDAEPPRPDKDAGGYAAVEEMRMLSALGFKCTFIARNLAWMAGYTETLQRMGIECIYAPFTFSVESVIESRGKEFDLVYITRYQVAEQYVDAIRTHAPQAKIVLNNADLHFLRELRAALAARSQEVMANAISTRDAELAVMRKVDLVLSYTDVERAVILSHNLDSTKVAKCPWVVTSPSHVPGHSARKDIAFLGGFNHHPNSEAVEWFVKNVMPLLRRELPGVVLRIYGSHASKAMEAIADDDVIIEGWVPDVSAVYDTARVFIAPLQSGAGIKGKVIGALAYGIPTVLSTVAVEGISLKEGVDAFVATKPEEWVSNIAKLYKDKNLWQATSDHARAFAKANFGFEKGVKQMKESLEIGEIFTAYDNNTLAAH